VLNFIILGPEFECAFSKANCRVLVFLASYICNELKKFIKCRRYLKVVVYIFQWENSLRLKVVVTLLVKSLSVFKHLMGRFKTTDIDYDMKLHIPMQQSHTVLVSLSRCDNACLST